MAHELGNYKFTDNTDEAKKAMDEAIIKALTAIGMFIESEAKEELGNDPIRIDTGLLRNSITWGITDKPVNSGEYMSNKKHRVSGSPVTPMKIGTYVGTMPHEKEKAVYIGTNVEYAVDVHEGTIKMTPNRFLKNAVTKNEEQIRNYIRKNIK